MKHPNRSRTSGSRDAAPTVVEIRAARIQAGLTRTEAARRIHSTLRAWQCWESEGEDNCRMHPALFAQFLIKTGQRNVLGRCPAHGGDDFDESGESGECVAGVAEPAAQEARKVERGHASRGFEGFVHPTAMRPDEAADQYVTRYGLRRIAGCPGEPTAASGPGSFAGVEVAAALERGLSRLGDRGRRLDRLSDAHGGREKLTR